MKTNPNHLSELPHEPFHSRLSLVYQQVFGQGRDMKAEELGEDVTTFQQAKKELLITKGLLTYAGYELTGTIIEIGEKETTRFAPRKLTWKERITGRIDPSITDCIPVARCKVECTDEAPIGS